MDVATPHRDVRVISWASFPGLDFCVARLRRRASTGSILVMGLSLVACVCGVFYFGYVRCLSSFGFGVYAPSFYAQRPCVSHSVSKGDVRKVNREHRKHLGVVGRVRKVNINVYRVYHNV